MKPRNVNTETIREISQDCWSSSWKEKGIVKRGKTKRKIKKIREKQERDAHLVLNRDGAGEESFLVLHPLLRRWVTHRRRHLKIILFFNCTNTFFDKAYNDGFTHSRRHFFSSSIGQKHLRNQTNTFGRWVTHLESKVFSSIFLWSVSYTNPP